MTTDERDLVVECLLLPWTVVHVEAVNGVGQTDVAPQPGRMRFSRRAFKTVGDAALG